MPRPRPWHVPLVAAFPVLALYTQNLADTDIGEVLPPLAVAVGGAVLLAGLLRLMLGSVLRAGLLASGLTLLFFSYGYVHQVARGTVLEGHRVLLPTWAVLAGGLVLLLARERRWAPATSRALTFASSCLVVVNLGVAATYQVREGGGAAPVAAPAGGTSVGERDIYYLIFDRYGGRRALESAFGFDNTPFLDALRSRGFYVADQSSGNYPRTLHSLASSLNMTHLLDLGDQVGPGMSAGRPLRQLLKDHAVGRFVQARGYRYVHLGSWWNATATNPQADRNITMGGLSEFSSTLLETTVAAPVIHRVFPGSDPLLREYRRVHFQFDQLSKVADDPARTFVFGHFLVPHSPYVLNRDGSFADAATTARRSEKQRYVEQVLFVNERILRLVDQLQAQPPDRRPIILLQSDEGPGERPPSWDRVSQRFLEEKFMILNAMYLPGIPDPDLYPTVTPVNTFRIVFDRYFDAGLGPLPDRVYVFRDAEHLYDFTDVTDRLLAGGMRRG